MDFTRSRLAALQTPVTSAPKCRASWIAAPPTVPDAPTTRTFSPRRIIPLVLRKCSAVEPPNDRAAASSSERLAGFGTIAPLAGIALNSAWHPMPMPELATTESPALNFVTFLPTATMSPANSEPRIRCRGPKRPSIGRASRLKPAGMSRLRTRQSPDDTVVARTLIRTSLSLIVGLVTSSIRTTSGGPYLS